MIMKKNKPSQQTNLQIGDVVKVRRGFKDPDTNMDMSNWHGRITELYPEHGTTMIAFDSQTLQNMPPGYDLTDLTKVEARDTLVNVHKTIKKLASEHLYDCLGDEGEEIQRIMQSIDPDDELAALDVWLEYLEQELKFPFEAVVDERQGRGPLRAGDKVRVHVIEDVDEHYGIIVKLRRGREQFYMPLCDLATIDKNSPTYHLIDLYRTWFTNR
jgi:hypothetical protein